MHSLCNKSAQRRMPVHHMSVHKNWWYTFNNTCLSILSIRKRSGPVFNLRGTKIHAWLDPKLSCSYSCKRDIMQCACIICQSCPHLQEDINASRELGLGYTGVHMAVFPHLGLGCTDFNSESWACILHCVTFLCKEPKIKKDATAEVNIKVKKIQLI